MSARVRFATRQDLSSLPLTDFYQGFTGFPSDMPRETTSATEPQLVVTLARAVEIIWRVRKVRIVWQITWETGTAPYREFHSINENSVRNNSIHASEMEIALGDYNAFGNSFNVTDNITYERGYPSTTASVNFRFGGLMAYVTDIAAPNLAFVGVNMGSTINDVGRVDNYAAFPAMSVVGTATIFGTSFNVYATTANNPVFTSGSIVEEEYWPYAATNNTAIYNTTTGAQLQSPAN